MKGSKKHVHCLWAWARANSRACKTFTVSSIWATYVVAVNTEHKATLNIGANIIRFDMCRSLMVYFYARTVFQGRCLQKWPVAMQKMCWA